MSDALNMPSQRQLKVGEEIRHVLSQLFLQDTIYHPDLTGVAITVSEVKVSPDLRNATVFVTPLAQAASSAFISALNEQSSYIRREMNRQLVLKYSPKLSFKQDQRFEHAARIHQVLDGIEQQAPVASGASLESVE